MAIGHVALGTRVNSERANRFGRKSKQWCLEDQMVCAEGKLTLQLLYLFTLLTVTVWL